MVNLHTEDTPEQKDRYQELMLPKRGIKSRKHLKDSHYLAFSWHLHAPDITTQQLCGIPVTLILLPSYCRAVVQLSNIHSYLLSHGICNCPENRNTWKLPKDTWQFKGSAVCSSGKSKPSVFTLKQLAPFTFRCSHSTGRRSNLVFGGKTQKVFFLTWNSSHQLLKELSDTHLQARKTRLSTISSCLFLIPTQENPSSLSIFTWRQSQ